jgi:hypothetical protein
MLTPIRTLAAGLLALCISSSWAGESQWELLKQKSAEAASRAKEKDTQATQAADALLQASEARRKAVTDASVKEARAAMAVAEARSTKVPAAQKTGSAAEEKNWPGFNMNSMWQTGCSSSQPAKRNAVSRSPRLNCRRHPMRQNRRRPN